LIIGNIIAISFLMPHAHVLLLFFVFHSFCDCYIDTANSVAGTVAQGPTSHTKSITFITGITGGT